MNRWRGCTGWSTNFRDAGLPMRNLRNLEPRNVFHRQLEKIDLPCDVHRNRHILFRRGLNLSQKPAAATMYITADDYYKLYINGRFVAQGPAPSYPQRMRYNAVEVADYLCPAQCHRRAHALPGPDQPRMGERRPGGTGCCATWWRTAKPCSKATRRSSRIRTRAMPRRARRAIRRSFWKRIIPPRRRSALRRRTLTTARGRMRRSGRRIICSRRRNQSADV